MFKTASVLVLRWWLQFRSFISSTSCKKLKLLLYRHVYPSCLRVGDTVEQLQVTVMAYSSMESRIGCSMKMASACHASLLQPSSEGGEPCLCLIVSFPALLPPCGSQQETAAATFPPTIKLTTSQCQGAIRHQ